MNNILILFAVIMSSTCAQELKELLRSHTKTFGTIRNMRGGFIPPDISSNAKLVHFGKWAHENVISPVDIEIIPYSSMNDGNCHVLSSYETAKAMRLVEAKNHDPKRRSLQEIIFQKSTNSDEIKRLSISHTWPGLVFFCPKNGLTDMDEWKPLPFKDLIKAHHQDLENCPFCTKEGKVYGDVKVFPRRDHEESKLHILAVPIDHSYVNALELRSETGDDLIDRLKQACVDYFHDNNLDCEDAEYGFHRPPLNSISHLHLHCVRAPFDEKFLRDKASGKWLSFDDAHAELKLHNRILAYDMLHNNH